MTPSAATLSLRSNHSNSKPLIKQFRSTFAPESEELVAEKKKKMGIIRSSFSFISGTVCGIYIAQNYNVPNIKKLGHCAVSMAKQLEEKYRKPKSRDDV
ncbi:hypothetical protein CARUB_v10006114mg [Capsella rubella]|uniref:Uncharacterized protein n=2 Tax=Capsella rubella TaxID=81985 RepID=R0F775_9BRAS|nr:hypothetical protein CARUB_v10006114mg [Capsella rubella]